MPRESSIAFRRGCAWTVFWGIVGIPVPLLVMLAVTVLPWCERDVPLAHRRLHLQWLLQDAPLPMLACGALVAGMAAATYFPKGSHRLRLTTLLVTAISFAVWIAEVLALGMVIGPRRQVHEDFGIVGLLVAIVFVVHAPLIVAMVLVAVRIRGRPAASDPEVQVPLKQRLAWFEPLAWLIGACLVSMFFWPALARSAEAGLRARCCRNLQKLAVAAYEYERQTGHPVEDIRGRGGQPLLSWRVALLPFLGEVDRMSQFRLDEPWDSANNAPLLRNRPDVLACPSLDLAEGATNYVLVGEDGHRAIMEAGQAQIPWTRPDDAGKNLFQNPQEPCGSPVSQPICERGFKDKGTGMHRTGSGAHSSGAGNHRVKLDQFPLPEGKTPDVEWMKAGDPAAP